MSIAPSASTSIDALADSTASAGSGAGAVQVVGTVVVGAVGAGVGDGVAGAVLAGGGGAVGAAVPVAGAAVVGAAVELVVEPSDVVVASDDVGAESSVDASGLAS